MRVLMQCGVDVIELPPDHERPDAVFVQDPVLVVDGLAIALRSAVASRAGEAQALIEVLRHYLPVTALEPPATLDGGDVLMTEDALVVGLSTRSNEAASRELERLTRRPVTAVKLPAGLLHLLSSCTYLGRGRLLAIDTLAPAFPQFELVRVPPQEPLAANVLVIDSHAVVPAGNPLTAALLQNVGFSVHAVPCSEFEKRDGGVTCRALFF